MLSVALRISSPILSLFLPPPPWPQRRNASSPKLFIITGTPSVEGD